ncbi:unnamed protein product [Meloidogyne enterolobii]|uniref:Uncharacterized protein n=1 Tax=Meloidogyne enterolobii TaxID=390850 RepID=A0ACB0ZUL8_MELEN
MQQRKSDVICFCIEKNGREEFFALNNWINGYVYVKCKQKIIMMIWLCVLWLTAF